MSLVPTMPAAIVPVTAAIVAPMIMVTAVTGEGVVGRTASLPGEALTRGDKDRENAECKQQQSKRPSDWDHPSFTRAGAAGRGIGVFTMRSETALVGARHRRDIIAVFWTTQLPRPQSSGNAAKHQQQDANSNPASVAHETPSAVLAGQVSNTKSAKQP